MKFKREEILAQLRNNIDAGKPIIGAGAGTGISAKCEAAGGIDLIIIYNSGRFRITLSLFSSQYLFISFSSSIVDSFCLNK